MMVSTPARASARPSPVMTSTPVERAIVDDLVAGGFEQLDDVAADPPGGSATAILVMLLSFVTSVGFAASVH